MSTATLLVEPVGTSPKNFALRDLLCQVESRAPDLSTEHFTYIDLSSVDAVSKQISSPRTVSIREAPSRARQRVLAGDVLVSTVRPNLNGVARVPDELDNTIASTGFCVLRADPEVLDSKYLYYWVRGDSFIASMSRRATGASYPAVSDSIVKNSNIPLPPLPEQRRIAAILDQADELRAKRRSAIALLDSLMDALFTSMFGDSRARAASPWCVKLSNVARISSGSTPDRKRPDYFGGGIPWVKTTEVHGDRILSAGESVSEAGRKSARLALFPADSIVIAMYGQGKTRGQSAVLGIDATVNQACAVILPSKRFQVDFMAQQLRLSYERLRAKAQGGNQANLNLQLVGDLDVLVPPIADQNLFAVKAKFLRELRNHHSSALSKLDELFASLQHRAFTGQL